MSYVAVYAYFQPYRNYYVNILETVTLIDILLMLTIASSVQFEVRTMYIMYNYMNRFQDAMFGQKVTFDVDHVDMLMW